MLSGSFDMLRLRTSPDRKSALYTPSFPGLGFPEAYPYRVVRNIDKIMTGKKDTLLHLTYYILYQIEKKSNR